MAPLTPYGGLPADPDLGAPAMLLPERTRGFVRNTTVLVRKVRPALPQGEVSGCFNWAVLVAIWVALIAWIATRVLRHHRCPAARVQRR